MIVLSPPKMEFRAHIESRCAERGLLCIAHSTRQSGYNDLPDDAYSFLDQIKGHDCLRMVLNGIEGRVYEPEEVPIQPRRSYELV